jgi:hypothetical protein
MGMLRRGLRRRCRCEEVVRFEDARVEGVWGMTLFSSATAWLSVAFPKVAGFLSLPRVADGGPC